MNNRASSLLEARRERLQRVLGRDLAPLGSESSLTPEARRYLSSEAENLYWNDLEWEHITDEEVLEEGPIAQLTFPGFLAFIRGLLLSEVMPDSKAPASPRPEVVEDVLRFLAQRVVELEDGLDDGVTEGGARMRTELEMTDKLIDLVFYNYYELDEAEVERVETARAASA